MSSQPGASSPRGTLGSERLGEELVSGDADDSDDMARAVVQAVASSAASNKGQLIGVFGRWGAGKTHLLNRVGPQLAREAKPGSVTYRIACFRAWEYEVEGNLVAAFVRSLVDKYSYPWTDLEADSSFLPNRTEALSLARELGTLALVFATDLLPAGSAQAQKVLDSLLKARKKEAGGVTHELPPSSIELFEQKWKQLLELILPRPDQFLVVLIDDLDRCAPPNLVRMLEWFKNHLRAERCTYVIGLDHRMAARAISGHYRDYLVSAQQDDQDYGYRYLDKVLELDFELQPSSSAERIALGRLGMAENGETSTAAWIKSKLGKDYPGETEVSALMSLPVLWIPRVTIRTLNTFRLALLALLAQNEVQPSLIRNDLLPSFPYWLLLISALHHTCPPERVEGLIKGLRMEFEGSAHRTSRHVVMKSIAEALGTFGSLDPRQELKEHLEYLSLEIPPSLQADWLYTASQRIAFRQ